MTKKIAGRSRRRPGDGKRNNRVAVRYTSGELARVEAEAVREGMVTAAWLGNAGLALARSHGRTGTRVSQEELDRLVDATEKVRRAGVLLNQVVVSIDLAGDAAQLAFLAHLGDAVANLLKRRRRRPRCGSWIQRCRAARQEGRIEPQDAIQGHMCHAANANRWSYSHPHD